MSDVTKPARIHIGLKQRHIVDAVPEYDAHRNVAQFVNRRSQPSRPQDALPTKSHGQTMLGEPFDSMNDQGEQHKGRHDDQQQLQRVENRGDHTVD